MNNEPFINHLSSDALTKKQLPKNRAGKKMKTFALGAIALGTLGQLGLARYFFCRTMIRKNASRGRTMDMSGTSWDQYIPGIRADKEWLRQQPQEEVFIPSADGLRLHGIFFPCGGQEDSSDRIAICFHGYTSEGLNDYSSLAKFYLKEGFHLLIVDERSHGKSEGTYIGFGCLDRMDAKLWMEYAVKRLGENCRILLQGISMGASTVLMASGLELPKQVKAIVSDCAFTSAYEVFQSVLKTMYHLPSFPLMNIANWMSKREAGYGLDECNARREVAKAQVPILFIHGDADTFVPCSFVYQLYGACRSEKKLVIIPGASHAEAYYKDTEAYENAVRSFITSFIKKGEPIS